MNILAIDPGTDKSGVVFWNGKVIESAEMDNEALIDRLRRDDWPCTPSLIACEMVACYGMAVGKEVFQTCVWIGRFREATTGISQFQRPLPFRFIFRKDIKMHLCQSMKAKDANIRRALIDKHGSVGTKKAPGKLYGISGHLWAALAVADYASEVSA